MCLKGEFEFWGKLKKLQTFGWYICLTQIFFFYYSYNFLENSPFWSFSTVGKLPALHHWNKCSLWNVLKAGFLLLAVKGKKRKIIKAAVQRQIKRQPQGSCSKQTFIKHSLLLLLASVLLNTTLIKELHVTTVLFAWRPDWIFMCFMNITGVLLNLLSVFSQ